MIRVNSQELLKAVKLVSPLTDKRHCLPILSHILVEANGHLQLTSTDLATTIRTVLYNHSEIDFSIAVPGGMFRDCCLDASGETELRPNDSGLIFNDAYGEKELTGMDPAGEFLKTLKQNLHRIDSSSLWALIVEPYRYLNQNLWRRQNPLKLMKVNTA